MVARGGIEPPTRHTQSELVTLPPQRRLQPDSILGTEQPERSNSVTISGIRSPRLCFGCAWQAGGLRVEGGRQAAAKLAIVSHDQAVGKSALAVLPVEKGLLQFSLVLDSWLVHCQRCAYQ